MNNDYTLIMIDNILNDLKKAAQYIMNVKSNLEVLKESLQSGEKDIEEQIVEALENVGITGNIKVSLEEYDD